MFFTLQTVFTNWERLLAVRADIVRPYGSKRKITKIKTTRPTGGLL
jgi:hypothetical protein